MRAAGFIKPFFKRNRVPCGKPAGRFIWKTIAIISILSFSSVICFAGNGADKAANVDKTNTNTSTSKASDAKLDAGKIKEANELYKKGKYKEALSEYTEAGAQNPQHPILNYNIGNVLYKTGKFQNAVEKYNVASSLDSSIYNIGNSLYKMQKLQEALAAYKQAIIKNPDDLDAKFNYEFISKMLQKQQNQNGNQNQDQQKKNDQKDQNKDQQQKQDQKDKKQGDQQQTKQEQKQIDPKQAESMLQALQQKEKDLLKKMQKEKQVKAVKTKKDW